MVDHKDSDDSSSELCFEMDELSLTADNVDEVSDGTASPNPDKPLNFMKLPKEIRNMIYKITLTNPDGRLFIGNKYSTALCRGRAVLGCKLTPFVPLSFYPEEYAASTRNLAILRTSKTVYGEASKIIYGQELIFIEMEALQSFLTGLRQQQISLLKHVTVDLDLFHVYESQRALMPSVFALLTGAEDLETLGIPDGLSLKTVFHGCMDCGHFTDDETLSVACWDSIVARNLAAEVYSRLYTYLRVVVPARGIEDVMKVLRVYEKMFMIGHDYMRLSLRPAHVVGAEWTEERKAAMKKVMARQIMDLLEADKN